MVLARGCGCTPLRGVGRISIQKALKSMLGAEDTPRSGVPPGTRKRDRPVAGPSWVLVWARALALALALLVGLVALVGPGGLVVGGHAAAGAALDGGAPGGLLDGGSI